MLFSSFLRHGPLNTKMGRELDRERVGRDLETCGQYRGDPEDKNESWNNSDRSPTSGRVFITRRVIENTTRVPVGDDLSYNEWFLKRI